jgi:hypothetical protein
MKDSDLPVLIAIGMTVSSLDLVAMKTTEGKSRINAAKRECFERFVGVHFP